MRERSSRRRILAAMGVVAVGAAIGGVGACGRAMGPALTGAYDAPVAASGAESGPAGGASAAADRLIARNLSMRVTTDAPGMALAETRKIVAELGGFVLGAAEEDAKHATATVRIPDDKRDDARARFAALGKVDEETLHGTDVTDAVRDLRIRLDNARRTRESYVALLARATSVEDTLKVEKELERVTVEIETLAGQLEEMEASVRYATFELIFARPVRPGPVGWVFYGGYVALKWLFV